MRQIRAMCLDDMNERHELFELAANKAWHSYHTYTARSADEAVAWLESEERLDFVTLDHDLGEAAYSGYAMASEPTGLKVAEYIAHMPEEKRPLEVNIHSWNPAGRQAMGRVLRDAGIMATGFLLKPNGASWVKFPFRSFPFRTDDEAAAARERDLPVGDRGEVE
jgi:hypothetical protein